MGGSSQGSGGGGGSPLDPPQFPAETRESGEEEKRPSRPSRPPNRVTLEFRGARLALPGEDDEEELVLDTGEFHVPDELRGPLDLEPETAPSEWLEDVPATSPKLELDLEEIDAMEAAPSSADPSASGDAWGRLRRVAPRAERPRSVTPPAAARDDALALVTQRSRPPSSPGLDLSTEMRERFALGDFSGALRAAEIVLGKRPTDSEAGMVATQSRDRLIQLHTARLAALCPAPGRALVWGRVPKVIVPESEIRWMGLDHRQGFVLSRVDGSASLEDIVDATGMTKLEILRTVVELVEARALTLV